MRHYIYCAGIDYEFKGLDFDQMALRRREARLKWARTQPGQDTSTIIFDVKSGSQSRHELRWVNGSPVEQRTPKKNTHKPVARQASYEGTEFKPGQPDVMSIVDVYRHVEEIGKEKPNTVMELSIISHGWFGGPILVNSRDRSPTPGTRDPNDKDGRFGKDFSLSYKTAEELKNFTTAFERNGYVWLWGCNIPEDLRVLLNLLWKSGIGSRSTDTVTLRSRRKDEIDVLLLFSETLQIRAADLMRPKGVDVPLARVKAALWPVLRSSYAYYIWQQTRVPAIGALAGTSAELHGGILSIATSSKYNAAVYKKLFDFQADPEGRGYAFHDSRMKPR